MTRIGKIARLPEAIRKELNQRLRDGQPARIILPWLNALPSVSEVMAALFGGQSINAQNLSAWRNGGFSDWLREQEQLERLDRFMALALELGKADAGNPGADARQSVPTGPGEDATQSTHGRLLKGACVLATAKIFEWLNADPGNIGIDELGKLITSLVRLRSADLAQERNRISGERIRLRDEALDLSWAKFEYTKRKDEETLSNRAPTNGDLKDEPGTEGLTPEEIQEVIFRKFEPLNHPLNPSATKGESNLIKAA